MLAGNVVLNRLFNQNLLYNILGERLRVKHILSRIVFTFICSSGGTKMIKIKKRIFHILYKKGLIRMPYMTKAVTSRDSRELSRYLISRELASLVSSRTLRTDKGNYHIVSFSENIITKSNNVRIFLFLFSRHIS